VCAHVNKEEEEVQSILAFFAGAGFVPMLHYSLGYSKVRRNALELFSIPWLAFSPAAFASFFLQPGPRPPHLALGPCCGPQNRETMRTRVSAWVSNCGLRTRENKERCFWGSQEEQQNLHKIQLQQLSGWAWAASGKQGTSFASGGFQEGTEPRGPPGMKTEPHPLLPSLPMG
jgi:hypothetical protein